MRILHTSDWHLGRTFHGFSLQETAQALLDELLELVENEGIDVLLISGDVYDLAQPRITTVNLLSQTLVRLSQAGCTVIATSGNHDSPARLGFAAPLLAASRVHLKTRPEELDQPVLVEKEGVQVAFYGLPYLEPRALAGRWGTEASHPAVLEYASHLALQDAQGRNLHATIALAHCFVAGAHTSDSERDISVGGLASTGADVFDGFDYVALGHLHGRQKITDRVRYSGSLLAYSFSEENHTKGAWILDITTDGISTITPYTWKTKVQLKTLTGTLHELLKNPDYQAYSDHFVRIYLTDNERPYAAADHLKTRFKHIAELHFTPANPSPAENRPYKSQDLEHKSPRHITEDFLTHIRQRSTSPAENTILNLAWEQARIREDGTC